jgi:hypothetical protein
VIANITVFCGETHPILRSKYNNIGFTQQVLSRNPRIRT